MYLLILLPILILISLGAVLSLMHGNPDKVLDDHYSYIDISN